MLTGIALAGALTLGTAAQAATVSSLDGTAMSPTLVNSAVSEYHCFDASDAGLSGTLRMDERTRTTGSAETEGHFNQAPAALECYLV